MVGNEPIYVLSVEDEVAHARLVEEMLGLDRSRRFYFSHCNTLEGALEKLGQEKIDVILLDLNLPDSRGYNTFVEIRDVAVAIPVILMTALNDEVVALRAIQEGAQDFLVKGEYDPKLLHRSIRYAIERHQMQSELRSLSLQDELTGLYNRRGFLTLADQHLKLARRTGQYFFIVCADLDDLKGINDTFGHVKGDETLRAAAMVMRRTFRESDIIARYGGDEFLVLVTDAINDDEGKIYQRFYQHIEKANQSRILNFEFSISIGIVRCEAQGDRTIEELIAQADRALYQDKQGEKKTSLPL